VRAPNAVRRAGAPHISMRKHAFTVFMGIFLSQDLIYCILYIREKSGLVTTNFPYRSKIIVIGLSTINIVTYRYSFSTKEKK
jgi:hypothetical protein